MATLLPLRQDDKVLLRFRGDDVETTVVMASSNHKSLALSADCFTFICLWDEEANQYVDVFGGGVLQLKRIEHDEQAQD